jgi:hypothetical protein
MNHLKFLLFTVTILFLSACGSNVDLSKKPVDEIVKNLNQVKDFSIILYDMDTEGSIFKKYRHQYQVIQGDSLSGGPKEEITGWYEVSKENFMENINNMGMEIVAKKDGILDKTVGPPGYGSYVGNTSYGHWTERNGTSFWEFYGQYAFMSSMFRLMTYPVTMSYWSDYHTNYYGTGRSYYGPSTGTGTYMYGTGSQFNNSRTASRWNSNASNNSFRDRVQGSTSKSSRSSSRFSPSSRTRSSGFGK